MSAATPVPDDSPADMLAHARAAAARGWRVFPLDHPALPVCASRHRVRAPQGKKQNVWVDVPCDGKRGKHPAGGWPATGDGPDDAQLLRWWNDHGVRNVGISCRRSRLLVLDDDTGTEVEQLIRRYEGDAGPSLSTYRVATGRGWHWYFADPDGQHGNTTGGLPEHVDVRGSLGNGGHGGYVVGAGSRHMDGSVYTAADDQAVPLKVPIWLSELLRAPRPIQAPAVGSGSEQGGRPASVAPSGGWTDEPRYGYAPDLLGQYRRHLDTVRTPGFRHSLFLAALDGWRCADLKLLGEHTMLLEIKQTIERVWGAPPDEFDRLIVYTEARAAATGSPWVLLDPREPGPAPSPGPGSTGLPGPSESAAAAFFADESAPTTTQHAGTQAGATPGLEQGIGPEPTPEELEAARLARLLAAKVEQLDIAEAARRHRAARDLPPLKRMSWREFKLAPQVEYLVPAMLHRRGVCRMFGPPGGTKSFLALDLALSVASGTPWRGHRMAQGVVFYVMAEGEEVNVPRALAWQHHNGVADELLDETFVPIGAGVLLTPEGIARLLADVVRDEPVLIVLDTKARMMDGNENDAVDNAVLVRALDALRDASGGCVLLVDHTGVHDETRARGGNSVLAAMGTEVRVSMDKDTRVASAVVTRDKAAPDGGAHWEYRLRSVSDVPGVAWDAPAPAVCVPLTEEDQRATPWLVSREWWTDLTELPAEVSALTGVGQEAARMVFRALRYVSDVDGLTQPQILALAAEGPLKITRSAGYRGITLLKEAAVLVSAGGTGKWVLDDRFRPVMAGRSK